MNGIFFKRDIDSEYQQIWINVLKKYDLKLYEDKIPAGYEDAIKKIILSESGIMKRSEKLKQMCIQLVDDARNIGIPDENIGKYIQYLIIAGVVYIDEDQWQEVFFCEYDHEEAERWQDILEKYDEEELHDIERFIPVKEKKAFMNSVMEKIIKEPVQPTGNASPVQPTDESETVPTEEELKQRFKKLVDAARSNRDTRRRY